MADGQGAGTAGTNKYLVPAVAAGAVVVLAVLVIFVSGSDARKMSDGSNGSADDSGLKELTAGVRYRDLKEGIGEPCPPGASVTMHYTGWVNNGDMFDSTREGKKSPQAALFSLGKLIKGWQEGIPGMKRGGIRKLVIAPEKGYGPQGQPPKIPGNSTLVFEVELVDFTPGVIPPRPRRTPAPTDLTKLSDGTAPGADDPNLKPIGSNGLKYRDLKEGDGPVCPEGATPIMDYIGWLTSGGNPFDSSWKPGREPLDMSLGRLIKGWQQGVPGMKVGGIRKLVIPPSLAYGSEDKGDIPPNSTLVFEIELLGIK
jgi:FKBP-type peptidyl-prolyl cis-trans isomerase